MDVFSKIDFHIHSVASGKTKSGDSEITKNSNIENINILVDKLNENDINLCAITDHNIFDKELYRELKKYENNGKSLKKVLPGVELDLQINNAIVHTICIFNDAKKNHDEMISNNFEQKNKYTLSELGNMLSKIGLDVILIAHQKTDYKAENQHSTNLSSCGIESFYRMIDVEFFDSLEVQSSKVEGILKSRFVEDKIKNQTLISGSDCHDWTVYPLHDKSKKKHPLLLKMKALPTFRGLVMAITNVKRFFVDEEPMKSCLINKIVYKKEGLEKSIEMSHGINAIIGDNSVGKSTLIKALLGKASRDALEFYKNHKIKIKEADVLEADYQFNPQGSIRSKFEGSDSKLAIKEDFKALFKEIDIGKYEKIISDVFQCFINLWEHNEKKQLNSRKLKEKITISSYDQSNSYYLLFKSPKTSLKNRYDGFTKSAVSQLESLKLFIDKFKTVVFNEDLEKLNKIYKELKEIKDKYAEKEIDVIFKNNIINSIRSSCDKYNRDTSRRKSIEEEEHGNYLKRINLTTASIAEGIRFKNTSPIDPFANFESFRIIQIDNKVGEYHFISKPIKQEDITEKVIIDFIKDKINIADVFSATKSQVLSNIRTKKFCDKVCSNLDELKSALLGEFSSTYFKTTVELKYGNDNLNEGNSAGINSLYYLDILSYYFDKKLFIIDQPEDDVSQTKINDVLLNSLRKFSDNAQVIIITHNPQLVVNLDVDNVIVIKKKDFSNEIEFINGPLELLTDDVDMLQLVANTLEGGIDVIKKRWKRYDKAN